MLSAVAAVLDLFTLNNVMLVKHRHIVLSLGKNYRLSICVELPTCRSPTWAWHCCCF